MMKKLYWIFVFALLAQAATAQRQALSLEQAEKRGFSLILLDSLYPSALHSNPELAVFSSEREQQDFRNSYEKLLSNLSAYLRKNGLKWDVPLQGYQYIYFAPDGTIDYFLYKLEPGQLTKKQEEIFSVLLNDFLDSYAFGMKASSRFARSSSVTFAPPKP